MVRKSCLNIIIHYDFNPLHPNISMHILHTVLHTFLKDLKRRICLTLMFDSGLIL